MPSHPRKDLEHELQPELHHAAASRPDERIAGRDIGRATAAAESAAVTRVIACVAVGRCAVGIGEIGFIEQVKDLDAELGAEPLPPLEVLEYGEVQVLEARIPEDVPAHGAKSPIQGRSQHRVTLHVAAADGQRRGVGGDRRALRPQRRGERGG